MRQAASCLLLACAGLLIQACASIYPDHFYKLQPLPAVQPAPARNQFTREVTVRVTLPSIVDRNQMILQLDNDIMVLEHERWASPLGDQLTLVLGQDIEARRPDILITTRALSQAAGVARASIQVDVVDLRRRRTGPVVLEARWHIDSPDGHTQAGRARFTAQVIGGNAAGYATGISQCVASLADQLAPLLGPDGATQPK